MRSGVLLLLALLFGCAPPTKPGSGLPQTPADKGLVYFYRPAEVDGRDTAFVVKENGLKIGTLRNGTFFYHYANPGRQYYSAAPVGVRRESMRDGQFMRIAAGEAHYVQAVPQLVPGGVRAWVFVKYEGQALPVIKRLARSRGNTVPPLMQELE